MLACVIYVSHIFIGDIPPIQGGTAWHSSSTTFLAVPSSRARQPRAHLQASPLSADVQASRKPRTNPRRKPTPPKASTTTRFRPTPKTSTSCFWARTRRSPPSSWPSRRATTRRRSSTSPRRPCRAASPRQCLRSPTAPPTCSPSAPSLPAPTSDKAMTWSSSAAPSPTAPSASRLSRTRTPTRSRKTSRGRRSAASAWRPAT